nr:hypothetical protein [uncultured Gellertiella sp.]
MLIDRFDRMVNRVTDRTFSTRIVIEPQVKSPNGRPKADNSRDWIETGAILSVAPDDGNFQKGDRSAGGQNDLRSTVPGRTWMASITLKCATAGPRSYIDELNMPIQGDRVTRPFNPEWGVFTIQRVLPDAGGRVVLVLTALPEAGPKRG